MGWCLHYFPFYIMKRQLFLHHYFPALYFAILLSCCVFDLVTSTLRPKVRLQIAAVLLVIAIWNYVYLSPLAYGSQWTRAKCNNARWLRTWDFAWYAVSISAMFGRLLTFRQISAKSTMRLYAPFLAFIPHHVLTWFDVCSTQNTTTSSRLHRRNRQQPPLRSGASAVVEEGSLS